MDIQFKTVRTKNTPAFWVRLCKALHAAGFDILDFHDPESWYGEWFVTLHGPHDWMFAEIALKQHGDNDAIGAVVHFNCPGPVSLLNAEKHLAYQEAWLRLKSALIALGIENLAQVEPEPTEEPEPTGEPEPTEEPENEPTNPGKPSHEAYKRASNALAQEYGHVMGVREDGWYDFPGLDEKAREIQAQMDGH